MKKSFANIYFRNPIIGKVSRINFLRIKGKHIAFHSMFAIKTCRMNENKIVRHLLREVSRATRFLLDKGANLTHLSSTRCHRSPLFQGGLEIPCTVKVCFHVSIKADRLIGKDKK